MKAVFKLIQKDFVLSAEMDFIKQIICAMHVIVAVQHAQIFLIVLHAQTVTTGELQTEVYAFLVQMVVPLVIIRIFVILAWISIIYIQIIVSAVPLVALHVLMVQLALAARLVY